MKLAEYSSNWLDKFIFNLNKTKEHDSPYSWLNQARNSAIDLLIKEPLPTRKMERWRYTPLNELLNLSLDVNLSTSTSAVDETSQSGHSDGRRK